ncbi:Protein hedgehog [Seminavis robusta]|uniref:Protein hedgehog n=1 Tax=Seminavis robusta TaxID=568900 RepID=A0A9N8EHP3_9STRA|nr:Protein hedgehog [Seminavis robusta]|eukprot:Sro1206_g252330.1 Protein hedgehog (310) ;mRNA; r:1039-1968
MYLNSKSSSTTNNNNAFVPPPSERGGSNCFSESATVQVENKGSVSMISLQVGDRVLTGSSIYQPVYSFGHRHEDLEGTFYQIYTDKSNHTPLEMTSGHLVFVLDNENQLQPVRADAVKAGDRVMKSESQEDDMHPALVTKVATIQKKGMYMPLTPDGLIIVDEILSSTYVSIQDQAPIVVDNSKLFPFLTEDKILHWFMSPVRMLCLGVSSNACQILERSRDEEGIHSYLMAGRSLAEFANQQGFFVQMFLIGIPVFLLFAFLNLLEVLLGGPGLAPFVCFAAITLGGWVVNKRHGMISNSQESNKKLE